MSIAVPSRLHVQTVDFQVSFFNKGTAEVLSRSVSPNSWKAAAFRAEQEGLSGCLEGNRDPGVRKLLLRLLCCA
eukprot:s621_g37.t5